MFIQLSKPYQRDYLRNSEMQKKKEFIRSMWEILGISEQWSKIWAEEAFAFRMKGQMDLDADDRICMPGGDA